MITIQIKKSQFNKDAEESMYVSFAYNLDKVNRLKNGLKKRYYIGDEKSWEVPIEEINQILTMFPDDEIKILADKVETVSITKPAKPAKMVKTFNKVKPENFQYKTTPFDYQIDSFNYALEHEKFLLGDEQGLGKTKQAIDIAVAKKGQFKHVLIVCGVNSLKYNWMSEIKIHSNESGRMLGSHYSIKKGFEGKIIQGSTQDILDDLQMLEDVDDYFLITNIENLRDVPKKEKGTKKVRTLSKQEQLKEDVLCELEKLIADGVIGMVIVDEIHKCKNAASQQGKALKRLSSFYKMALTGTPLMNKPSDLYVPLNWLGVDKNSYYMFQKRYVEFGGYSGKEIVGYKHTDELRSKLESVMLRRKKAEVLNLPPKIRQVDYVEMTDGQKKIYKEVRDMIVKNLDKIALSDNPLAELLRLRQVTGYTGLLSSSIQESAKLDRMEDIIEELVENGQKAIVFSNWEEMTKVARERLAKYNPAYITGSVDNATRDVEKIRFQNDPNCKVIIGTIGAMGTGLTLTAANTVIFLDKPWNPANTEQAEDRAHRIGTTGTVNIVTLVCKDTIDERIEEILATKGDIFVALVDGKMDKIRKFELLERLIV